jgi:hypothetical protein
MALYYRIFLKIKLTAQVVNRDIYHFWFDSRVYPLIIVDDEVSILLACFYVFGISSLYKSDVKENIIGHSWLTHITPSLSAAPVSYHTTSHAVHSGEFDKNTYIGQCA